MSNNISEIASIKGGYEKFQERGAFEDICTSYDSEILRYFLDGAKVLIDELDMLGVESVLDVGTGTGHTALELAKRYPRCRIVGIDNSPGMLGKAKQKKGNLSNVSFMEHDWEELEQLPDTYDIVTNSFGISFVQDLNKFATSVTSKVKSNGFFAFINFDDGGWEPFGAQLFSDLGKMSLLRRVPSPLSTTNKELVKIMEGKGYKTLKVKDIRLKYPLEEPEQWWTIVTRTAIKENFVYHISKKELEAFKSEHLANIQQLLDEGVNTYPVDMTLYVGQFQPWTSPGKDI